MHLRIACLERPLSAAVALVLALAPQVAKSQVARRCDYVIADSARAANRSGRHADAIRLAESIAESCPVAPYVLYYSHRSRGSIAEFRAFARPLAERGNADFAFYLAQDLTDRLFIPSSASQNLADALRFFEIAHRAGNALATKSLGEFYFAGRFRSRDVTAPRQSYQRAAEYFRDCRYDSIVGRDCLEGLGQVLLRELFRTREALALLDSADALEALWAVHEFGLLRVAMDTVVARRIERRMLSYRDTSDVSNASSIQAFGEDLREYRQGDARAAREIAHRFNDDGVNGIPDDGPTFVRYAKESVARGSAGAASDLGDAYATGRVARSDRVAAYMYYNIALDRGDIELQERVRTLQARLAEQMPAEEVTEAQRLTREFLARTNRRP